MRTVPASITNAWLSEDKTGPNRPIVRATVQKVMLQKHQYDTALAPGDFEEGRSRVGWYTTIGLGNATAAVEIPNLRSVSWSRGVTQDVAECTLTLKNTALNPIGTISDDFDLPGHLTYNRGEVNAGNARWGYTDDTGWNGRLVPDRLVRTYEGYGCDRSQEPAYDPFLVQSGTWLIISAEYSSDGDIVLNMQDVGCLLIKQIVFPPVVPYGEYPLEWDRIHSKQVDARDVTGGDWRALNTTRATASSSNEKYVGEGLTNPPYGNYVGSGGVVNGHHPDHALEMDTDSYWLSTGQGKFTDFVWFQYDLKDPVAMNAVRIHTYGGPYKVYVSLHNGEKWLGNKEIPYEPGEGPGGVDIDADIPFVKIIRPEKGLPEEFTLNRKYGNITKIRYTFTQLRDGGVGTYPFRAGLRDSHAYIGANRDALGFTHGKVLKQVGNYRDYTDIVKWACAWGGFWWPSPDTNADFSVVGSNPANKVNLAYASRDPRLAKGRVWGDFMNSGTYGATTLTMDLFDKKPLLDMISYVRDILGYIFFIDETGGVVWRMPNRWDLGNYMSPPALGVRSRARTATIIDIDEEETLLSYSTTLSTEDTRERIFVGNATGKVGTVIRGFNPYWSGFRRIAGWTDQNFGTKQETRVMADMIAAEQLFEYRRSQVRIKANPAIQIDDQVRIWERVTNETFYHYVESISCTLDMDSGEWTYDMETHWLGENPATKWAVSKSQLDGVTQAYLNIQGNQDT